MSFFIEGFDHGEDHRLFDNPYGETPSGTYSIVSSPIWGEAGYALRINPTSGTARVAVGTRWGAGGTAGGKQDPNQSGASMSALFAFRLAAAPSANCRVATFDGGPHRIALSTTRTLGVATPSGTTYGSSVLSLDTWYLLAFWAAYGTTGTVQLNIYSAGGALVEHIQQTFTSASALSPDSLWFGPGATVTVDYYIDAVLVQYGGYQDLLSWLGYGANYRVGLLVPDANGEEVDTWGTHTPDYTQIDEVPPDHATTYVAYQQDAKSTYKCTDPQAQIPTLSDNIKIVQGYCHVKENSDPSTNIYFAFKPVGGSWSSSSTGSTVNNWTNWAAHWGTALETDPLDSNAWTISKLTGFQWGMGIGNDPNMMLTAAYCELVYRKIAGGNKVIWFMSEIWDKLQENRRKVGVADPGGFRPDPQTGLLLPRRELVTI